MVAEALFAAVLTIGLPLRAWRRYRRGAPPVSNARYIIETSLLIGILSLLLWHNGVSVRALGLKRLSPRWLGEVAVCLGVVAGTDWWMAEKRVRQIRNSQAVAAPTGLAADALAGSRAGGSYIAVLLVGATWEELCFRAAIFALLPHSAAGIVLGVIAGSLAFGAQHLRNGPPGMMYSTGFGVVFALLFLATGNLCAVVAAHAGGNLLTAFRWAPQIERARQSAAPPAPIFFG